MVECDLAKVEVAGSNPVSRSIFFWRHSQVVRQRSAKPLFTSSNLVAASKDIKGLLNIGNPFVFGRVRLGVTFFPSPSNSSMSNSQKKFKKSGAAAPDKFAKRIYLILE